MDVRLREVRDSDLPAFHAMLRDPEATRMAAFTAENPDDQARFDASWAEILDAADPLRTVLADGEVVGNAAVSGPEGRREVSYWIDRSHWGRGIATAALRELLALVPERPLYGRVAADNEASLRVLRKCGFTEDGRNRDFAPARGTELDEVILTLDA